MQDFVLTNLDVYGPLAVFILLMLSGMGLPLGEDLVIIPAGIFVHNGDLPFWPTLIAAYIGVVCSDCLWFTICHRYGSHLIHMRWFKRMVHPRRLLEVKHQVEQRGIWVIVMARFIPASRTPTITIAGLLHLPFWKFALATASCVCITAPMQLGLGYLIGKGIGSQRHADLILYLIGGIVLIVAIGLIVRWWRINQPTKRRLPRARMEWLKRFRVPRPRMPKIISTSRRCKRQSPATDSSQSGS
jgi:membrane protein DedA with SNARE-associated domain